MSKLPKPQELNRIAVVCFGGLGDVLLFSPVLSELKHWLPHCHISLFVEARSAAVAQVLETINAVVPIESPNHKRKQLFDEVSKSLKERHFDAVLSTGTSPFIALMLAASGIPYRVGYSGGWWSQGLLSSRVKANPNQYASALYFDLAQAFLWPLLKETYTPKTLLLPQVKAPTETEQRTILPLLLQEAVEGVRKQHLLLHPGVSQMGLKKGINKTWSASAWAELILHLSRDHFVYLTGGPDDAEMVNAISTTLPGSLKHFANLVGKTKSVAELATLMSLMDAIVCVDSAPLHLAVGLHKPTVALFGPTNEQKLTPPASPLVKTVSVAGLACRPCLWHNRKQNCAASTCLNIEPQHVVKTLEALLGLSLTWTGK